MADGLKIPVLQTAFYTIYYEGIELPTGGCMTFVHCDIHTKWTRFIKKNLEEDFGLLTGMRLDPLYCARHDAKQEKFIRMFGFRYLYSLPEHDLDIYQLET